MKGAVELGDQPGGFGLLLGFRLVVFGGSRIGVRGLAAGGRRLFGALAESSIHEDSGRLHAVVGGGVFAEALSDILEHVDDFACAVGFGEDSVCEIECPTAVARMCCWDGIGVERFWRCSVRWELLGCGLVHRFSQRTIVHGVGGWLRSLGWRFIAEALSDILEHVDDFACAVGFGEDSVCEVPG